MEFDFDLFVIGGGSGGVRAARLAAEKGLRVGLAEADRMGGTCVIRGCVPKKLMLFAGDMRSVADLANGYGWSHENGTFDWKKFHQKLAAELDRLENVYQGIMDRNDVRVFKAFAQLEDGHHVALDNGLRFSAERILIAAGGRPYVPEVEGSDLVVTSNDVFHLPEIPKRIAIVGGGYIASEFAGIFAGMGAHVTQLYRGDLILRGYDAEMRQAILEAMQSRGIDMRMNEDVVRIEKGDRGKRVHLKSGDILEVDEVLYATGRVANIEGLNLESAGVEIAKGAIKVNGLSQTNVESVYAIGDITGRAALTPVAIREAVNFIKTVYEENPTQIDYTRIPTAIFTRPEFGTIGLGEEAAREAGHDIDVYQTSFTPMKNSFADQRSLSDKLHMKLIVDRQTDVVLGVHILGEGAGEMIQLVGIAVTMGATKTQFDDTIAVHPTSAEELVTMKMPR